MATQIGPKIGIEGEKEYRQQIAQIINQTKTLQSSMQKTASSWDKNTSEMTKNAAKAQNLTQQIDLQKQKLEYLNTMLEQSTAKYGENATATMSWQRSVNYATAALNQMEQELKSFKGAEGLSEMSLKIADFGTKMQNIGHSMTAVGRKMTTAITLPLAAAGTAAVDLASTMTEASGKVDVIFGSMSDSVKQFAETSLDAYGVSNVKAMQLLGTFGAMATEMGISQDVAANMATTLTGLSGDLAAFHNVEVDVAANSLEGIFTGQTKALTQFAGAINQANLEEFAQKQGKVYSKMSEAEKVMLRYQLVLERTSAAQGNFAATGDGTAGSIQKFKGAVQQLGVAFGQQLLPIITPIIQKLTEMIQAFASLPEPIQKIVVVTLLLAAVLGPLIMLIGGVVSAIGAAAPALGVIAVAIASIAAGIAIGSAALSAFDEMSRTVQNVKTIVVSAWDLLMAVNDKLKENVHKAVTNIVTAFGEMPQKIVDAIKRTVTAIKNEFDNIIRNAKESGKHFVEGFVEGIKARIGKVVDACKKVAKTVQDFLGFTRPDKGPLHEYEVWMPHFMQGLAKGIKSNVGLVKGAVNDVAKTMALPLDSNATMNMALAGAGADGSSYMGGTTMNVYVDHISELNDLLRIQNQSKQMIRMGAR